MRNQCGVDGLLFPSQEPVRGLGRRCARIAGGALDGDLCVPPRQRAKTTHSHVAISFSEHSLERAFRLRHVFMQYQWRPDVVSAWKRLRSRCDRRIGGAQCRYASPCFGADLGDSWFAGVGCRAFARIGQARIAISSAVLPRGNAAIGLLIATASPVCRIEPVSTSCCWSARAPFRRAAHARLRCC